MPLFRSLRSLRAHPAFRPFIITASALSWLPIWFFVQENYYQIMSVQGPSMYPFLNTDYHSTTQKNKVLVDMRVPMLRLRRGTVVAFWSPKNPERMVVKRIIALEGDEVTTRSPPYPFAKEIVPTGYVWVEGDNPDERKTNDSNDYGPVSKSLIVGQLRAIVWPWHSAGRIDWRDYKGSAKVAERKHPVKPAELHY